MTALKVLGGVLLVTVLLAPEFWMMVVQAIVLTLLDWLTS